MIKYYKMKLNLKLIILIAFLISILTACDKKPESINDAYKSNDKISKVHVIKFDDNVATFDGKKVREYDYVWHIDSKGDYDEVKDSPAEYFTGDKPDESEGVYIAHDIRYFPIIDKNKFYKSERNNDPEWNVNYDNEKYKDLVFASLPRNYDGDEVPIHMMHSEEEAYRNLCFHITKPGTYELSGNLNGQILVDLGKDAEKDFDKKINLIFNNLNADCTVAPAVYIYRTYECDNKWKERKVSTKDIDIKDAGANIIIKDNTKNHLNGANVYRIYKNVLKKNGKEQKVAYKYDATIQSATTLSIGGESLNNGELYVNSTFEGISTDLHLALYGANVYINANDDGINCSEDNASIIKINDGNLYINSGLLYQGDGIDSNGYIEINGGNVVTAAKYEQDPGIDATKGLYINGGNIVALGEKKTNDWPDIYMGENTDQSYVFKSFDSVMPKDSRLVVIDESGNKIYEFSENNIPHISEKARPFRGVLISNTNIKKDVKYEVIVE